MKLKINSQTSLDDAHRFLDEYWSKHKHVTLTIEKRQRTLTQNAAIHKYFSMLCEELNSEGLSVRATLIEGFELPWTDELVKEMLWKPVQKAIFKTISTTKLKTNEVSTVYDHINRKMIEMDVFVPFPQKEDL